MGALDNEGLEKVWLKMKEYVSRNSGGGAGTHNHDDRYYTETEIDSKLGEKAPLNHTHDDRYYTETEINNKLKTKTSTGAGSYASLSDFVSFVASANTGMSYVGKWKDTGG